jgi:prolyl oligopeptidase
MQSRAAAVQARGRFPARAPGAIMSAPMNTRTVFHVSPSARGLALALLAAVPALVALQNCQGAEPSRPIPRVARAPITYPPARLDDTFDDYHGTRVADPYRWLEDSDAPDTREWIDAEVRVWEAYLARIPERAALRQRIERLWDYEKFELPEREGGRTFYRYNDGLQNQSVLYVVDGEGREPRVLLDPNGLSKDGTVALAGSALSEDGRWLAYGLAEAGSDWNTWRVRDVESGLDLPDMLRWVKFSGAAWMKDGSGFFYSRYDAPERGAEMSGVNKEQKLYFHARNTDQSADVLVYSRSDQPEWGFGAEVSEDGRYLVIRVSHGTSPKNRSFYAELPSSEALRAGQRLNVVELLSENDAAYSFVGNDGPLFWYRTDLEAPRGRLIAIDTRDGARERWTTLIPQSDDVLQGVSVVGERFLASYLEDAHTLVRVFDLAGEHERDVDLPGLGTAGGFDGERAESDTFYVFTSFTTPGEVWRYDVASGRSELYRKPELAYDPALYATEQVFYSSKDGTRVPMFLTYRKGLARDGANPVLLYGYGGFNQSLTPAFSAARIAWLELGGVFAQANLRGGGEYGEEWHKAGTLLQKQNVFDDFIAAAEWLIDERWTSTPRLAIQGGSNGGLLVGACMTQRPDLFGACLPAVGVMDMLRFQNFTIGWAWKSDYGSSEDPEQFKALFAYSPLHNLRSATCYPPTLITTADHDDRVVPGHSFKFAAALQRAQACDNPTLIRIDVRAGHGAGKPTSKRIDEAADQAAFLVRELALEVPQGFGQGPAVGPGSEPGIAAER